MLVFIFLICYELFYSSVDHSLSQSSVSNSQVPELTVFIYLGSEFMSFVL